jgi:hypothetical protein
MEAVQGGLEPIVHRINKLDGSIVRDTLSCEGSVSAARGEMTARARSAAVTTARLVLNRIFLCGIRGN